MNHPLRMMIMSVFDPIEGVVHMIIKRTKHECRLPLEIDSSRVDKYHAFYP